MKQRMGRLLGILLLAAMAAGGQQEVPDAPSATRPPQPTVPAAPPARPMPPPSETVPSRESQPQQDPRPAPATEAPPNGAPAADTNSRDQMFTLSARVDFVVVPVTVKDQSGRLVNGLLKKDFSVYENEAEQEIRLFTSDPFPLSAAVVLDAGVPESVMQRVRETLPALAAAFSEFDEVAFYTFDQSVERTLDFSAATERLGGSLTRIKPRGRSGGAPVVTGPMTGAPSPSINNRPLDPGASHVPTYRRPSKVLNDAILRAALDLSERERTRRKVIFVISDGREYNSNASYSEVLKVLLSNEIMVYAIGVGQAATPIFDRAARINLPGTGHGNLLPKYASATGGALYAELDRNAIESAYSRVAMEARNLYTVGYTTRATPSSTYRTIEVVVKRPDCSKDNSPNCVNVYAREGYYPLPPPARGNR